MWWFLSSQPSKSIKTLLNIGNIAHNSVEVNIFKGENKSPEFLKVNPREKVPVIRDGSFTLTESNAILKYLCETRNSIPEHMYPSDPIKRS